MYLNTVSVNVGSVAACFNVSIISAQEAALFLQKSGIVQRADVSMEIVYSDIQDQYRLFNSLEKLLKNPPKLMDQQIYQMDAEMQRQIIQRCRLLTKDFVPVFCMNFLCKELA